MERSSVGGEVGEGRRDEIVNGAGEGKSSEFADVLLAVAAGLGTRLAF